MIFSSPLPGPHLGAPGHLDGLRSPSSTPPAEHRLASGHWCFRVTQTFGSTTGYYQGRPHGAVDFGNYKCGDPVLAAADGTAVRYVDSAKALAVVISHGSGWVSRYWHLAAWTIPAGSSRVRRGQQIGVVGNTGLGAVCHLHFEIEHNGTKVDPWPLLSQNRPPEEDDMKLAGKWIGHVANRRARLGVTARFRAAPTLSSSTLAIFPARTSFYPIAKVVGDAVGSRSDAAEWYAGINYVSTPAESGGPVGWVLGYYHSSTLEGEAGVELEAVELSGIPEERYATDVKTARRAGADGAVQAAGRYAAGL